LLKFVASAGQARRKAAKKRNVWGNHEHFGPLSNAASPSAAEFQQTARGSVIGTRIPQKIIAASALVAGVFR
jgi:hypothetical protein